MQIEALYELYLSHPSVETDTRKLKPGDIFFALKGPSFNGNAFAKQALDAGAAYVVVDEKEHAIPGRTFLADDVLTALQALAHHHRQQFHIPFLAITGSNGKTTTKELVHAVLSSRFITYTTSGNLNNHIGIPLTILRVKGDAQFAVIEMGANHRKEIEGYCEYTMPTHGIITNAGKAHLEGFGGEEGVKKGKGELYDYLRAHNGMAFVNWDYDYLRTMSQGIASVYKYGTGATTLCGNVLKSDPFLEVGFSQGMHGVIRSQLVGDYNLPNVLAAAAVGLHFGVDEANIKNAIENYTPSNSRSQLIQSGTNKIILDAYNANPSSMQAAIENFARQPGAAKVLMLGAMAELGTESLEEHKKLVALIGRFSWKAVVLTGGDFLKINHPYISFENVGQARDWLRQQELQNCSILIKGSRSMQMEKVLEKV